MTKLGCGVEGGGGWGSGFYRFCCIIKNKDKHVYAPVPPILIIDKLICHRYVESSPWSVVEVLYEPLTIPHLLSTQGTCVNQCTMDVTFEYSQFRSQVRD